MAQLKLAFLGAPEVCFYGRAVAFRTRKELALLVHLAVEGGFQPREKLTALLWPESDARRGQMSLRRALASLRSTLADAAAPIPAPVLMEGAKLGFDFGSDFELDVAVLESAARISHAPNARESPLPEHYADQLQAVVDLYRGDFLEGFNLKNAHGFDEWASLRRESCHRQMDSIFDRLSQLQIDTGQLTRSLETSMRWVAHNSLNEIAYRRLMRVHLVAGDRTAALEAYEDCRRRLLAELRLEPSPETTALAERVRAEAQPARREEAQSAGTLSPMLREPFVGRAEEHGKLVEHYLAAQRGQGQVVSVSGEPGIGKTRLAAEFLSWAKAQGALVLSGRAFETGGNLPYQPWTEILWSSVVREAASPDLLSEVWLGELSRLLPVLIDRYPGISPLTVDEPTSQIRMFESVALLGEAMAKRAPLVIFFDDIQWADSASLDLLHYVARRWDELEAPVLLLLNLRLEALTSVHMTEWFSNLQRELACSRLTLEPLSHADTREWVRTLARADANPDSFDQFSQWLQDETGGQPFYIKAMLEALLEQGILYPQADGSGAIEFQVAASDTERLHSFIPAGVRQVILARLAKLNEEARALLSAGAVLGRRFNLELLCQVADLPLNKGLHALDQLLASHLLYEQRGDEGRSAGRPYVFSHDKIRDVVYTEAGAARRRIFHQRALNALTNSTAPAAELAGHAFAGGLMEPAFRFSLAAGDEAMGLVATQEAIANYSRAHELIDQNQVEGLDREHFIHLYINFGRALEIHGRFPEALETYEELQALGRQHKDGAMELAALLARVALYALPTSISDSVLAKTLSEQALALSRDLDDQAAEARLLWCLSHVYRVTNRMAEAIEAGERSLALARSLNLREQIAYTLNDLGTHCYFMNGHMDQAMAALREASDMWKALGNLPMLVDSLASIALASSFAGEYAQVLTFAEEAYRVSKSTGNLWGQSYSRMAVGPVFWEHGDTDQAIAAMEESVHISESAGFSVPQALTRADLAALYGSLGAIERALELAHLALNHAEASIPRSDLYILATIADLYMLDGSLAEAEAYLARARGNVDDDIFPVFLARVMLADCELALKQSKYERALEVSDGIITRLSQSGLQAFLPRAQYLRGQALLGLGQGEAAEKCLLDARAIAESLGSRRWLLPILVIMSQLGGDPGEVQDLRTQARGITEYVLGHTGEPDLRTSFRSLAHVREVMQD